MPRRKKQSNTKMNYHILETDAIKEKKKQLKIIFGINVIFSEQKILVEAYLRWCRIKKSLFYDTFKNKFVHAFKNFQIKTAKFYFSCETGKKFPSKALVG